MSRLPEIDAQQVQGLLNDFVTRLASGPLAGNFEKTEQLLRKILPNRRAEQIMAEIRGPAGRNIWQKLSNVRDEILAGYLKNEYPQTVAVILSKITTDQAARVLALLPDEFAIETVDRMLRMEPVPQTVLERIEETLRIEFMAEIFNAFDRPTEGRMLTALDEINRQAADRIRSLMFTFEDLTRLDSNTAQVIVRSVDRDLLARALKGSADFVKDFFFEAMSQRAVKILLEDMATIGPLRLKDVDDAQQAILQIVKDLATKGDIVLSKSRGDDEMVF
jgi:flagellar motor switch protein FliG